MFPLCPFHLSHASTTTVNPHTIVHIHGLYVFVPCLIPSPSFFFQLYFIDYGITVVPIFPPLSLLHPAPPTPSSNLHTIVHVHGSLAAPFPILYLISPWLFCNYLFVLLNPLTSSPIPPHTPPSGNHQNALCIHDPVLLICLVCFLDSIVDR